ncbi:DUF3017 domain-containing protein [Haloechinothrix halophila]|uniref:DUF3017 domain-containing protein n=1 Tax=Haloechinothrix halophila YIM 93223 TaxID=592678 RepID=W9DN66_9PSEU|nr:DUF3017 domain-containing protein [Haloechinothrix halophila]ETA66300.1 Protein of unknown function (DUF3017) [Haloechinothrix halophila YIM 93223]
MSAKRASEHLLAHLPFGLVLAIVASGFVRIAQYHWREGTVLIAGALFVAAVLRAVLMPEKAGLLVIRGRAIDVLAYTAFSALILFVSLTIAQGPTG